MAIAGAEHLPPPAMILGERLQLEALERPFLTPELPSTSAKEVIEHHMAQEEILSQRVVPGGWQIGPTAAEPAAEGPSIAQQLMDQWQGLNGGDGAWGGGGAPVILGMPHPVNSGPGRPNAPTTPSAPKPPSWPDSKDYMDLKSVREQVRAMSPDRALRWLEYLAHVWKDVPLMLEPIAVVYNDLRRDIAGTKPNMIF